MEEAGSSADRKPLPGFHRERPGSVGVGLDSPDRNEYVPVVVNIHPQAGVLRRRDAIVHLVQQEPVRSQEELQGLLALRGIDVAQPTLSRDVRELGLVKTPRGYALPGATDPRAEAERRLGRLERVLAEAVLSVRAAGSLVVLRTPPAGAHPVARALDEAGLPEAVGTIAGDDTVFLAAADAAAARTLAARLSHPGAPAPARRRRD